MRHFNLIFIALKTVRHTPSPSPLVEPLSETAIELTLRQKFAAFGNHFHA